MNSKPAISYLQSSEQQTLIDKCISTNALKVISRLKKANFKAYLVGGAIRDILLGKHPKDFDVATDATPEEIRKLFKNALIIGRRFQIVHIRFGREIIEVTTFRGKHEPTETNKKSKVSAISKEGMLLRDNVFGNMEEDAERRDFSVNALYLDPDKGAIYDYHNGLKDLDDRALHLIGDPDTRFKEDPVRVLRAARFVSKLDFTLDNDTIASMKAHAPLLHKISPSRLFDESLKLYNAGFGEKMFRTLCEFELLPYLLFDHKPLSDEQSLPRKLADCALKNTDKRLSEGKSITPAFIYAVFLWPTVQRLMDTHKAQDVPLFTAFHLAATEAQTLQGQLTHIPKRLQTAMREIWELQFRLTQTTPKKAERTVTHPRFRAGYDFLLLREEAGEIPTELGAFWTEYQKQHPLPEKPKKTYNTRKPRRRPNKPK
ncbi:MAG: polynucleotide adenylyltransferase PcnB [Cellvibrionales bacterium]|nr:polynucleotide adenylyltransferase PcnB [Cellvibrionales bacterium]